MKHVKELTVFLKDGKFEHFEVLPLGADVQCEVMGGVVLDDSKCPAAENAVAESAELALQV